MTERTTVHRLQVATELHRFIEDQVLPGTGVEPAAFWQGFDQIVHDLAPKNAALLAERDRLQAEIDAWHKANPGPIRNMRKYRAFLQKIGYLVPVPAKVKVTTKNVDAELALQAGPQLVVPITNARYALNAANARWGSLYDALYGTDVIAEDGGADKGSGYNPKRGAKVIEYARHVLDRCAPLAKGSHLDSTAYRVVDSKLAVTLKDGKTVGLKNPAQFVGFQGETDAPSGVLLSHHGLHWTSASTRAHRSAATTRPACATWCSNPAAVDHPSTCEDSVARGRRRRQGAGLRQLARHPAGHADRRGRQGRQDLHPRPEPRPPVHRPARRGRGAARPLAAVRAQRRPPDDNPAVLWGDGEEIPEGILDAVVTTTIALHDLKRAATPSIRNSRHGSVYIVKPKMHGPAEVAFAANCSAASSSCSACPRPRSSSASWTRSAAPAST